MLKHLCGVPVCQRPARSVVSRLRGMLRVIAVVPPFWRTFPTTIWLPRHPLLPLIPEPPHNHWNKLSLTKSETLLYIYRDLTLTSKDCVYQYIHFKMSNAMDNFTPIT